MTCIVASVSHRTVASDSQCSDDNSKVGVSKIRRFKRSIIGAAGGWSEILSFWDLLDGKEVKEGVFHDQAEFCAIELALDGIYLFDPACHRYRIKDDFFAIGSGAGYALGAMALGASPVEAISVASRFDPGTGGEIETIALRVARNAKSLKR